MTQPQNFNFDRQLEFQKIENHKHMFATAFQSMGFEIIDVADKSNENISFCDLNYKLRKNGVCYEGWIECKDDSYDTPNMVNELIAVIAPMFLKSIKLCQRISASNSVYHALHGIIQQVLEKRIQAKLGLGLAHDVDDAHILAYYYSKTRTCFYWKTRELSVFTQECLKHHSADLIVTRSFRNSSEWNTISMLIPKAKLNHCLITQFTRP